LAPAFLEQHLPVKPVSKGNGVWSLINALILEAMYIVKIWRESIFTNMGLIFFIHPIRKSGIL
jgi:hypothetical protein